MNNVLFSKCEEVAPELFSEEWKGNFRDCFKEILKKQSLEGHVPFWDCFYHALIAGHGGYVPAPFAFYPEYRDAQWAIQARLELSEWVGLDLEPLILEWVEGEGWKVSVEEDEA